MTGRSISPTVSPEIQVRRAWVVLLLASLAFTLIVAGSVAGGIWVYRHATVPHPASLEVISGSGALVRSPVDPDWRLITSGTRIREGDRVSTALGTVVRLTMFDGSSVEVSEDTVVAVRRMRSSRFLDRTKLVVIEPERGMVYLKMVPRGDHTVSEMTVIAGDVRVTMTDEPGHPNAGAFQVEVIDETGDGSGNHQVRAAVLRGAAMVRTPVTRQRLEGNQQTVIEPNGWIGSITESRRELLVNGTFGHGLAGWIEFRQALGQIGPTTSVGSSIELVREPSPAGNTIAAEFLRSGQHQDIAQTGLRQRVGKTLRVYSSLQLQFEGRISDQAPGGGSEDGQQFPLIVKLNYIDAQGQEREWWHGYYVLDDPEHPVPPDRATRIERGRWQKFVLDLGNLSPAPKQISSFVVYASGQRYQTTIANLSLTSSELADPGAD